MSDRKDVEAFKTLVRTGARTVPRAAEPLIPGSSIHGEDARVILDELRARHRIDVIPNTPPAANREETKKPAGKAAAAAPAGQSPSGATSAESEAEEEGLPEDSQVPSSRMRKLRSRLAKLTADIGRMEAKNAKKSGTK